MLNVRLTSKPANFVHIEMISGAALAQSQSDGVHAVARNCNELAEAAESDPAKKRYRRMAAAWLDLAEEQDWLDGQMPRP